MCSSHRCRSFMRMARKLSAVGSSQRRSTVAYLQRTEEMAEQLEGPLSRSAAALWHIWPVSASISLSSESGMLTSPRSSSAKLQLERKEFAVMLDDECMLAVRLGGGAGLPSGVSIAVSGLPPPGEHTPPLEPQKQPSEMLSCVRDSRSW